MVDAFNKAERTLEGNNFLFLVVSFWIGAAIMIFELAGARLFMPLFGSSIQVWTIVITVTLASLSVGYWLGGVIIDCRPSVVTLSLILLISSFLLILVYIYNNTILTLFENMSLVAGAGIAAVSILFLPLLFLGMVQPSLARLMVHTTVRTGSVVGGLMAAGTAGGILGTAFTGLFSIPYLGLKTTLLITTLGTFIAAIFVMSFLRQRRITIGVSVFAIFLITSAYFLKPSMKPPGKMNLLEEVEGLYGHLEVLEYHGTIALACNGIFQTLLPSMTFGITKGTLIRGRNYIELIPFFRPKAKSALLIGVGAGLYSRDLSLYGIDVNGVEIEPAVIKLAKKFFGFTGQVNIADGRVFLVHDKHRYDAIISDAYIGGNAPEHLFTKEFFELVDKHLNPDSIFAVHLIGSPKHPATLAIIKTIENVFPYVILVKSGIANELQDIFIFANRNEMDLGTISRMELRKYGFTGEEFFQADTNNTSILTDDKTNLTLLSSEIIAAHRYNSLKLRKYPLW